jgi:Ca-activated chloride channel family protein
LVALVVGGISAHAQRPAFRSAIDLVLMNVTVTGPGGRYVGDLTADDFDVFEDGHPQEIAFFAPSNVPLSASLIVDTSSSMDEEMASAQKAALDFISKLRPGDIAEVVSFDSRVEVLQPLTSNRQLLETAIKRLRAGGSTALYNAVYIVLSQLAKTKPENTDDIRRQVIVVLSDGDDTSSLVTFDQLLDAAKRSQTVIYSIGLGLEGSASPPIRRSDGEFALRRLTQDTGGRLFLPSKPTDLIDVYSQISAELTNQYVLGFLSNSASGGEGWRQLSVRLRRPNLTARTRAGYVAGSP